MVQLFAILLLSAATSSCVAAAGTQQPPPLLVRTVSADTVAADSASVGEKEAKVAPRKAPPDPARKFKPTDVHVVVSVSKRRLYVIARKDTLLRTTVSVAEGHDLSYGGRKWRFATPRGKLLVQSRRKDPVWTPPDWHYAEVARQYFLKLRNLPSSGARLKDGSRLVVRDSIVGVLKKGDTTFYALPESEHVVFDSTLFIPPASTRNRRLRGELGAYALDLGNGYLVHGTPDESTIGSATTHGCIRVPEPELAWMFRHIPNGATVFVR